MDLVGLGWRPELATGILSNLERVDVVEVLVDRHVQADGRELRALRTLGVQVPVVAHAVSLGLASASPVDEARLSAVAKVIAGIEPRWWSEHLAFVRAGGIELGHLAAPPRNRAALDGVVRNVERAAAVIGSRPLLENVASLIDTPGSTMTEPAWLRATLAATGCDLLLDLHNLHANATNFGFLAHAVLDAIDINKIRAVHIAGGRNVEHGSVQRLLDDHLHPVPDAVFALLEEVASRVDRPLTVVLERDGAYPAFDELLGELDRARAAVAEGRARAAFGASPYRGPMR